MAINILTEPQDPPISGDFTRDQAIQRSNETPMVSILTDWESTASAPLAKQGAFIRHAANTFQVQSSDEAISGSVTAGLNYIIATESAGVITLAWATTLAGYSYNPAYGGVYDSSGNQALRDLCYLDGSDYLRGMSSGEDINTYYLANGTMFAGYNIIGGNDLFVGHNLTAGYNIIGENDLFAGHNLIAGNNLIVGNNLDVVNDLVVNGSFTPGGSTSGNFSLGVTTWTIPRGVYSFSSPSSSSIYVEINVNGWKRLGSIALATTQVMSDGINYRVSNLVGTQTVYWRKH